MNYFNDTSYIFISEEYNIIKFKCDKEHITTLKLTTFKNKLR